MSTYEPRPQPHEFDGSFDGVNCAHLFWPAPGPAKGCTAGREDAIHDPYYWK